MSRSSLLTLACVLACTTTPTAESGRPSGTANTGTSTDLTVSDSALTVSGGPGPNTSAADTDRATDTETGSDTDGPDDEPWPVPLDAIYVDIELAGDCPDYSPELRQCSAGSNQAYATIATAAQNAVAGETVVIRGGTYNEPLAPANSGLPGQTLVFRSYPNETPVLTGDLSPAINLEGLSYIHVYGLEIRDVPRWMRGFESSYVTLENCRFINATDAGSGSKAGIDFRHGGYNRVIGCYIDGNPADSLSLIDSHYNLIADNEMYDGGHALFAVRGSSSNVFRNNNFHNESQKIGEFYDLSNFPNTPDALDSTRYNLIEGNEFAYVPSSGDASPFSGIQYAGQASILRGNIFHDTVGPALRMSLYGTEATFNTDNRIYHNVFHSTDFAGVDIAGGGDGYTLENNEFVNNVFSGSAFVANDTRWDWWVNTVAGKPVQIKTARLSGFVFDTNCVSAGGLDQPWLITYGWRNAIWPQQETLAWWEANMGGLLANTLTADPQFIDTAAGDFRLSAGSALIDAGRFLTTAVGTGESSVIEVGDASYFYDGYGIEGELGDRIQLQGGDSARIVAVDRANNTLTLDTPVSWSAGQGVSLSFQGAAPDIGAYEIR